MKRTPGRYLSLLLAALTLNACVAEDPSLLEAGDGEEIAEVAELEAAIWMDPKLKGAKINTQISAWRKDLEAQLMLAPPKFQFEDPSITSISPMTAMRGQQITITGRQFTRMTWFGHRFAVSFQAGAVRSLASATSMTSTQIVVTVPANATTGRIRLVNTTNGNAVWAESALPLTINIPQPTTGVARFTNDSQFEVQVLTVNGQNMIPIGQVLPPGGSFGVVQPGSNVPFHAELGLWGLTMVIFDGSVNIVNGQTSSVSIRRFRAADAFTMGAPSAIFDGWWTDNNFGQHLSTMVFYPNGTYELWSDNVFVGSSSYGDGAFNPGSPIVNVAINNTTIGIDFPYASFFLNNGPPTWPLIEYVRR